MMAKKLYYYDEFGDLTNEVLPNRATDVAPPESWAENEKINFDGCGWQVVFVSPKIEIPLETAQKQKISAIRGWSNGIIQAAKSDTAHYEVDTWDTQRNEYTSWLASQKSPTPYLDALASARGISRDDMMAKVGKKIAAFAQVQGTQQALEKRVMAATTAADLAAINLPA